MTTLDPDSFDGVGDIVGVTEGFTNLGIPPLKLIRPVTTAKKTITTTSPKTKEIILLKLSI